jgi:hypothetical protein
MTPSVSETTGEFTLAQARADKVARAFGDSAPRAMDGESLVAYRHRLLAPFKQHSATWRTAEIPHRADVLAIAERQIYADALHQANNPVIPPGTLLERITTDRTGRRISSFQGDPGAWLDDFKCPAKCVTGFGQPR